MNAFFHISISRNSLFGIVITLGNLFFLALPSYSSAAFADTDYTWTGAVNTDWNNPNNWTPSGFTGSLDNDNVIIPLTANQPVVGPATSSCKQILTMAGVTISGSGTLTIANINAIASVTGTATISCNLSFPTRVDITNEADLTISGIISGASLEFNKFGEGILTLSGVNTFTGATTIAAGILSVATIGNGGTPGNLGQASGIADNLVLDGGTLQYTGATASTNRSFTLGAATTSTIEITTNTLTITGAAASTNGALIKSGSGTLILGGANLYSGTTTIFDGTLQLSAAERIFNSSALVVSIGATFDLAGFNETVGSIAGEGTITSTIAGNPILAAGSDNTSTTFSGLIQNGSSTSVSFTKTGSGTLTLSTTNTYTGVTSINAGILSVSVIGNGGVAGNIGQASNAAGNLALGGGTLQYIGVTTSTDRAFTLTTSTTSAIDLTTNPLTISGAISGGGSITKNGVGTLILTALNTYTGITRINAGIVRVATIGNGGTAGNLGQASSASGNLVLSGGTLEYIGVSASTDRGFSLGAASSSIINITTNNLTISGIITGPSTGNISKAGLGTLTISGTNTYTGTTSINEGVLSITTFGNGGSPSNIGASSNAAANLIFAGGTMEYTGATASSTRSFTLANTTTSTIEIVANNLTIGGSAASSTGSLIKTGNGKLTLTGSNLYEGTTLVIAGILNTQKAQGTGTSTSGVTVTAGSALEIETTIAVLGETLSLNSTGVSDGGAFRNISGLNSWSGLVTLSTPSRINSDAGTLMITGGIDGNGQGLTIGGAGATTISTSGINTSTGGYLTKDGIGTLTIGVASSYTGATIINSGVLNIQNGAATGTIDEGITVIGGAALQMQGGIIVGAEALTLNGTGISNTGSLRNISGNNTYGGLITIASNVKMSSDAGVLTLDVPSGNAITGSFNLTIDGIGNTLVSDPIATGIGSLTKSGTGTLTLTSTNTYTGGTVITAGTIILDASNILGDAGAISLDGGILRTGTTVGFNETVNTLDLNASSTIALGTGSHIFSFAASNGISWTPSAILTITGWTGGYDGTSSATAGRIFVGSSASGLTAAQVVQIQFFDGINNLPAKILSDGEVVPAGKAYYAIASANWNVSSTWSLTTGGPAAPTFPTAGDIVFIGESVSGTDVTIPANFTAACTNLTIGNITSNTLVGSSLTLSTSTSALNVSGPLTLNRPAGNLTNAFHIGNGIVTVGGSLTFDGTTNNSNRIARLDMNAGALTISGALVFNTNASATAVTNVIDMSGGAGTLNLGGPFTLTNNIGTLTPGATSTFNFNGTAAQTIPMGISSVTYNHLMINNTNPAGATISAAISASRVSGNITVGNINSGSVFNTGNLTVTLAASKSLTIADNSTINAGTSSISIGSTPPNPAVIINGVFKTANLSGFTGIAGGSINTTNSPVTALGSNSTIEYLAASTQPVSQRTDYANVTLAGGSKTIPSGTITLLKSLTIQTGATYNGANNPTLTIGGDFLNSGTFTQGTGTLSLNGTTNQTIGGSSMTEFNSLTINKSSGVVLLAINATVAGTLTLTNGIIDGVTNNKTLTIGASGIATSGSNASHVNGKLSRIFTGTGSKNFPIGKGGSFREVTLNYTSLIGTSTVVAEQFETTIPGIIPVIYTVQSGRHWDITQSGGSSFVYDITLNGSPFMPGTEDPFILKGDGITNTGYLATYTNPDFTTTGLMAFSKFAVAYGCITPTISVQPGGSTSCLGDMASMNVVANGSGTITYQWYKVGAGIVNDGGSISGATTNTISFNPVTADLAGTYYAIATSSCNSTVQSTNAELVVNAVTGGTGSSDQTICSGDDPSELSVANASGNGTITYQWISGTISCSNDLANIAGATSSTYDPPSGLTQTTYFKRIISSMVNSVVCQDTSTCSIVTVNQNPSTATITNSTLDYCGTVTSGSLEGNTPSIGIGLWSIVSGASGTFNNASIGGATFTGEAYGTYVLRWTISNNPCPSSSADVTVNYYAIPTIATVGSNQNICGSVTSTSLGGNTPSEGSGMWSQLSGPGTSIFSVPSSGNATATATLYGEYIYRWTISNGTCPPSIADITVIYYDQPVVSNQANQSQCNTSTFTMTQSNPPVGTGIWTLVNGTVSINTPGSPITSITGLATGTSATVRWTVINGTCNAFDDVVLQNDLQPAVSNQPNQTLCNTSSFIMTQSTPPVGSGNWTLINGSATITTPGSPTTSVSGVMAGTTATVRWTVTNGTCEAFDEVTLQNDAQPAVSNQPNQSLCNTSSFIMTQSTPTAGTGIWNLVSGSATISNPSDPMTVVTGIVSGANATVRWTVTNGTCSAFDNVTVQNDISPVVSDQPNQTLCNTSLFTMTQSAPSIGSGIWSLINGSANISDTSDPMTTVSGVVSGTIATVRWSVTNGACTVFDDVVLQNDAQPVVSNQPNQVLCNTSSFIMTQSTPSVGTGLWTLVNGTAIITTPGSPITTITGVPVGTSATVKWTVTNGTCSAFDNVNLQNDIQPAVSNQPDQSLCNTSSFTMTQSVPSIGTGIWTLISGSASITDPGDPMTSISGVSAGTSATVRWTVTNGTCNTFDNVSVQNDIQPTVSNQPNQVMCNTSTFTMTQSTPSVGTGLWTLVSGSANITSPGSPTSTITGVAAGASATVKWTVTNGTCIAFDNVTIQNDILPIVNNQPDQTLCNTSSFTMSQDAPSVGSGIWTLISGTATITDPGDPMTTITGVVAGTIATIRWTVTNGACSGFDNVAVQNDAQPVVSNQPNQMACNTSSFGMSQSTPSFGVGVWTLISGSAIITDANDPVTTITGVGIGTSATIRWTVSNGLCNAFDDVTVVNNATIVSTNSDEGPGSLRDIVSCAPAGSIITFAPSLIGQTILLTSGEIEINKDLILTGPGVVDLVISGNNASRIFHLLSGHSVTIKNMSMINASAVTNGGALFAEGSLILENVLLQNNFENGSNKAMTLISPAMLEIIGNVLFKN